MVVFGDFDQVVHGHLQLVAGHCGNHHSVQLGCELSHVLLIGVHQTLEKKASVTAADCTVKCELLSCFTISQSSRMNGLIV